MTEKCMYCENDALIKHEDFELYCGQCWMKKEYSDATTHTPRSRTFTSSKAGGRTLSQRLPSHRYKTP